jgi:endonuclease/exonuclease/phosphatase family metal-dependent hydrolase
MHTIRVQTRQDGFSIDQIVLSPNTYLTSSPGLPKNDTVTLARTRRDVIIWADDVTTANTHGAWSKVTDAGAAGQVALHHPDAGAAAVTTPFAAPVDYFDVTFTAEAAVPYHLWIRGRAQNDSDANESVWVQFTDSVDAAQNPVFRIGTTTATEVNLEDCSECNVHGWGWQDNGWISTGGQMGPDIYFPTTGPRTLRVQTRQDGFFIDQVVLSPVPYLATRPGQLQDDGLILASTLNARPKVELSADTNSGSAPLTVNFQAIAYDPDGAAVSYLWTFRPGFTSTGPPPQQHTYPAGEYTPTLRVTDSAGKFTQAGVSISSQTTTATVRFKYLAWNVQHGEMADDTTQNLEDVAQYIKNQGVSVVALNEAPVSSYGYSDYAFQLRNRLQEIMTGRTWKYRWVQPDGNALLWLEPSSDPAATRGFTTVSETAPIYDYTTYRNYDRSAGSVTLSIAGRNVTFIVTHLDCACGDADGNVPTREAEATEFRTWDDSVGPIRIVGGDFNAETPANLSDPTAEQTIPRIRLDYNDAWVSAPVKTTDHPSGDDRTTTWSGSYRVDYIFFVKNISNFSIVSMKHGYPKNAAGIVLSDHFPLIATFDIW